MGKYLQQNKQAIEHGFRWLRTSKDAIIENGMITLAEAGLAFLLEAHDNHPIAYKHPEDDNTMGYAIAHDGTIIHSAAFFGGKSQDLPGTAREDAERLLSGTTGWVAIVLSDMEAYWYRWDWETGFLQYSADEIRHRFHEFFKPVAR